MSLVGDMHSVNNTDMSISTAVI